MKCRCVVLLRQFNNTPKKHSPYRMTNEDADLKDFSTFMRFFCTRMVQAIVQSRMGIMQTTPCLPNPEQSNWFNIVIDEIGEVAAHLKSTIGKSYPPKVPALSLEFILYTADGDTLPLETWVVRVDKECQDWSVNIRTALYQQMSILLKSIIVASRFTPTYRYYVRNQGPESFVIIYRVYVGEPDLTILGETQEIRYRRLGYLPSPFGTLSVELNFRTKMEIQPRPLDEIAPANLVTSETKNQGIPIGVIPNENSKIVPMSPASTENINLFSTSPLSDDFSFKTTKSKNIHVERSLSSPDAIDHNRSNSSRSFKDQQEASPPTSSSFPQRTSLHRLRIRNNSFPFASLLLYSQSSSEQLKTLPNVPEDAALNTGFVTSKSERLLEEHSTKEPVEELRRNSSTGIEMVAYSDESDEKGRPSTKVLFACDSAENQEEECEKSGIQLVADNAKKRRIDDDDDDDDDDEEEEERDENSSDDSYVKVIAFADHTDQNMGLDLGEFFKEVRLAPHELSFFSEDSTSELGKQLDDFCKKEHTFTQFVNALKGHGEGSDEDEQQEK